MLSTANIRPQLEVSKTTLRVTTGKKAGLKVTASDPDSNDVTIRLLSTLPAGASFDSVSGKFTWTPQSAKAVSIRWVGVKTYRLRHCIIGIVGVYRFDVIVFIGTPFDPIVLDQKESR